MDHDKTLLWAVDAFESSSEILDSAVRTLKMLAPRLDAKIQPVYVLTPAEMNFSTEFSEIDQGAEIEAYRPAAENLLNGLLKKFSDMTFMPAKVLLVDSTSTQIAVETLARYATGSNAEAIVVSSHNRHGLGRFFLGSFAETLMAHSGCPVVIAHPGVITGSHQGTDRMLIPTDLTDSGYDHYLEALETARKLNFAVTLFHVVSYPIEPMVQSGVYLIGGGWMPLYSFMYEEVSRRQAKLDQWVKEGQQKGLRIRGVLYSEGGSLSEAILKIAIEDKSGLIAMRIQTGPIASALLGSVTREVVRNAHSPVWVTGHSKRHRPSASEKSKTAA
jgi:nucleotide-binding universal stress UspA family protein